MFSVYQVQILLKKKDNSKRHLYNYQFSKIEKSQDNSLLAQRVEVMTTAEVLIEILHLFAQTFISISLSAEV